MAEEVQTTQTDPNASAGGNVDANAQGGTGEQPVLGADGKPVTPAEGVKTEGEQKDETKPDAGKTDEAKDEGAPDEYKFEFPQGIEPDLKLVDDFKALAKANNLTQDVANQFMALGTKIVENQIATVTEALTTSGEQWAESSRADKEFGGDSLKENLAIANAAMTKFGSPELATLLKDTKLGNHPEIIRAFFRVGKQVSGDKGHTGAGRENGAKPFYGNSQHARTS